MIYLWGLVVGIVVVAGQLLWRAAVRSASLGSVGALLSTDGLKLVLSPRMLGGVLLYGVGAAIYLYLQGKYDYHLVQVVVIVSSLLLSFAATVGLLDERLRPEDFIGLALLLIGVVLIGRR